MIFDINNSAIHHYSYTPLFLYTTMSNHLKVTRSKNTSFVVTKTESRAVTELVISGKVTGGSEIVDLTDKGMHSCDFGKAKLVILAGNNPSILKHIAADSVLCYDIRGIGNQRAVNNSIVGNIANITRLVFLRNNTSGKDCYNGIHAGRLIEENASSNLTAEYVYKRLITGSKGTSLWIKEFIAEEHWAGFDLYLASITKARADFKLAQQMKKANPEDLFQIMSSNHTVFSAAERNAITLANQYTQTAKEIATSHLAKAQKAMQQFKL